MQDLGDRRARTSLDENFTSEEAAAIEFADMFCRLALRARQRMTQFVLPTKNAGIRRHQSCSAKTDSSANVSNIAAGVVYGIIFSIIPLTLWACIAALIGARISKR